MRKRFLPPATVGLLVSLVVLSALNVHAQGTPPARLRGDGVGPLAPVASNDTEEGRAKNRRVELVEQ